MKLLSTLRISIPIFPILLALLAMCVLPGRVCAQVSTADIVGTMTDATGAAVPGVTVVAKNKATNEAHSAKSGEGGDFSIPLLPIGSYTVTFQMQGFKTSETTVTLSQGDRLRLDQSLAVGALEEKVEVTSTQPVLQTDSSSTGTLIGATSVQNLPLNGRNCVNLVQLAAGAADAPQLCCMGGNSTDDKRLTSAVQINGQYPWSNNFLIDGMDDNERFIGTVTVKPAIDSIAEMRIITSTYSADLGRTAGGVINMITKSGTNGIHGTAFEFFRNEVLDARNFFARASQVKKPPFRQNQFGGSLGGPIQRDKTFLFADYEGLRLRQTTISTTTVPTASERAGIYTTPIYDPTSCSVATNPTVAAPTCTRTAFPNVGGVYTIPTNRIDAAAAKLLALVPLPNAGTALTNNYVSTPVTANNQDEMDMRLDQHFSDVTRGYLRYTYANIRQVQPGFFPVVAAGSTTNQSTHGLSVDVSRTLNSKTNLELQAGWSRYYLATLPGTYGQNLSAKALGLPNTNTDSLSSGFSSFTTTDGLLSTLGDGGFTPEYNTNDTFEINGNIVRQVGAHSLKFGAVDRYRMDTIYQQQSAPGTFAFSSQQTQAATTDATGNNVTYGAGGASIASLLLGYTNQYTRIKQLSQPGYLFKESGAYLQDDWRAGRRLTLNLGLRYDYYGTPYTTNDQIVNFNYSTNHLVQADTNGFGRTAGVSTQEARNFSPRVGFAYNPSSSTVIRGGGGISLIPLFLGTPGSMRNAPFISQYQTLSGPIVPNFSLTNQNQVGGQNSAYVYPIVPLPTAQDINNPIGTILSTMPKLVVPYVYQTNLTVQQQLGANVLSVTYVGVFGRAQPYPNSYLDINQPYPGSNSATAIQSRRPFSNVTYAGSGGLSQVQSVYVYGNLGTNKYNALQVTFERRLKRGLELVSNYTWGHALDNFEYQQTAATFAAVRAGNPLSGWNQPNGNASIDLRHRFTLSATYKIPFFRNSNMFLKGALGGWGINSIIQLQTGLAYNVTNATDVLGIASEGGNRTDIEGDYRASGNFGQTTRTDCLSTTPGTGNRNASGNPIFMNPCAFATPPAYNATTNMIPRYGTLGRFQEFGPNLKTVAFTAAKTFHIYEALNMEFRGEFFNLFNHPNFGNPTSTFPNGSFGIIGATAAGNSFIQRNVQVATKFTF